LLLFKALNDVDKTVLDDFVEIKKIVAADAQSKVVLFIAMC
jgi:hypothetical protein